MMRRLGLILGAIAMALLGGAAAADNYRAPRNALGQPDLQGVWNTHFILPMEARPDMPSLTLPEAEATEFARKLNVEAGKLAIFAQDPEVAEIRSDPSRSNLAIVRGQRRTRQVVQPADGMLPLTRGMRGQMRFIEQLLRTQTEPPFPTEGPELRPNWERCVVGWGQPPIASTGDINPRQIVQTRDVVVILTEYGPDLRIIPITDKHGPPLQASALGDAIAHWEGETLVIETIGLPEKDALRPFPTLFVPANAKVIERYTRVSKTELLYQYTVVDPTIYTAPWLAEYSLYRTDKPIFEFACHEGNYSLPNILAGARRQERDKAAATKP
ncbi:hypothetical protein [Phenylobacterium sp.]|uniref:hypothetical protein n=1 Tax=Phenylobacterium sp. TaxID=1871053 RepID=UPI00122AF582|nr:hypothetical protein [Phenylobacterium sp.]THD71103.1 MAG: hypothetical protein E8A12_01975 [Phenylobacterium sp.]